MAKALFPDLNRIYSSLICPPSSMGWRKKGGQERGGGGSILITYFHQSQATHQLPSYTVIGGEEEEDRGKLTLANNFHHPPDNFHVHQTTSTVHQPTSTITAELHRYQEISMTPLPHPN